MTQPRLRIRSSGFQGSGYAFPVVDGSKGKMVTNADGDKFEARLHADGSTLVLPGVTTVLKVLDKPAVQQWKADSVAARAVANLDALLNRSMEEGFEYLRFAADDKLNDAGQLGTNMHEWIQADLGFGFYPEVDSVEMEQMIEQWELFKFEHTISNVHWAERTVANFDAGYAGTADLMWDIDDRVNEMVDIKTSRSLWDDHSMQLSALYMCEQEFNEITPNVWEESTFIKPESLAFLHLRPHDFDTKGNAIPAFCRVESLFMDDVPVYYAGFTGALIAAKSRYEMKQRLKARQ